MAVLNAVGRALDADHAAAAAWLYDALSCAAPRARARARGRRDRRAEPGDHRRLRPLRPDRRAPAARPGHRRHRARPRPGADRALRRFGFKVYYGDATRLDLLRAAGARAARSCWWSRSTTRQAAMQLGEARAPALPAPAAHRARAQPHRRLRIRRDGRARRCARCSARRSMRAERILARWASAGRGGAHRASAFANTTRRRSRSRRRTATT